MTRRRSSFLLPNTHVPSVSEAADISSVAKHALHIFLLLFFIYVFEDRFALNVLRENYVPLSPPDEDEIPAEGLGPIFTTILYFSRLATLLLLPQAAFNFAGLVMFNAFKRRVPMKHSTLDSDALAITFRIVTRGSDPDKIREVVRRNLEVLNDSPAQVQAYRLEVITEEPIGIEKYGNFLERVVPKDYLGGHSSGKARALQYCLEEPSESLGSNEWVVHLDESAVLSEDAIMGILNFACSGRAQFGSGLTTYANDGITNWLTSIINSAQIAEDLGQTRFQLKIFHKPLLAWKGSFYVTSVPTERQVGYRRRSSIIIDDRVNPEEHFAAISSRLGYGFDWIDGEVWARSESSLAEQIFNRKKRLQGQPPISAAHNTPYSVVQHWASRLLPLTLPSLMFGLLWSVPTLFILDLVCGFIFAVRAYAYTFGVLRHPAEKSIMIPMALASPFVFLLDSVLEPAIGLLAMVHKET